MDAGDAKAISVGSARFGRSVGLTGSLHSRAPRCVRRCITGLRLFRVSWPIDGSITYSIGWVR